ncbi:MAG: hypothetical protein H7Y88_06030, partial [Phycisphaerales bacterium]|nr:hypothetical protein [Phycisphaerales bacterium]
GFVVSQDQGVTWTRLWDDTASPASDQGPKLREWCPSAAPVWNRSSQIQGSPLECWICSSDYRHSTSSTGGRVYVFRMARPNASTAWSFGPVSGTGLVKYFDIPGAIRAHAHAAQITEYKSSGLQMLASMGDGLQNRLVRHVMVNRNLDYTNAANWSVTDDYHGRYPHGSVTATNSFQPIGAAFGPEPGTVLWGSDQYTDWLNLVRMPDVDGTGLSAQCSIEHIYGLSTGAGYKTYDVSETVDITVPNIFVMNQGRPETNGPIVASFHDSRVTGRVSVDRVLYSPGLDVLKATFNTRRYTFMQVAAARVGELTCCTYGSFIYFNGFNGTNPDYVGLRRIPAPSYKIVQPILVAPGGKNMVKATCWVNGDGPLSTFTPMTQVGGQWVDGTQVLTPPSMGDRLIKINMLTSDSSNLGLIGVSRAQGGTNWNDVSPSWLNNLAQVRRFRGWLLDGSKGRKTPNKTLGFSVSFNQGDSTNLTASGIQYSSGDQWCPITRIARRFIPGPTIGRTGLVLGVIGNSGGNPVFTDDNYGWVIIDLAQDGNGSLSYPQPPEQDGPDELLTVLQLGLGHAINWSLRLAGVHPIGNWDQYADRTGALPTIEDRRWPLFTIWGDDNNWIEFIANCQDNTFRVKVRANGGSISTTDFGSRLFWIADAPLYVGFGYKPSTSQLFVGASLGGDQVQIATISAAFGEALTELRFRGRTGGVSNQGEVCEFRWPGGEIVTEGTPLDTTTLPTAFSDLSFLDGP